MGGVLCLDFANTVDARFPRPGERPPDYIDDYDKLVRWSRRSGALDDAASRELLERARQAPDQARAAVADAIALREAIHAFFAAALTGHEPPAPAARTLRRFAAEAIRHGTLVAPTNAPGFAWRWSDPAPRRMLWPIAISALSLATSHELERLKRCPGQDGRCGWLFLDRTKNQGRRWCSMRLCGNPVKARRQHARRRAARRALGR